MNALEVIGQAFRAARAFNESVRSFAEKLDTKPTPNAVQWLERCHEVECALDRTQRERDELRVQLDMARESANNLYSSLNKARSTACGQLKMLDELKAEVHSREDRWHKLQARLWKYGRAELAPAVCLYTDDDARDNPTAFGTARMCAGILRELGDLFLPPEELAGLAGKLDQPAPCRDRENRQTQHGYMYMSNPCAMCKRYRADDILGKTGKCAATGLQVDGYRDTCAIHEDTRKAPAPNVSPGPVLGVKLLRDGARPPERATPGSAGLDLFACLDEPLQVEYGHSAKVPLGIAGALPEGMCALVFGRSGNSVRGDFLYLLGLIDSDYRGEWAAMVKAEPPGWGVAVGGRRRTIKHGDKVAQALVLKAEMIPVEILQELSETARGAGGFGSTGQ